jgi:hypothetical protein
VALDRFMDSNVGTPQVGKQADLTVLQDPFSIARPIDPRDPGLDDYGCREG